MLSEKKRNETINGEEILLGWGGIKKRTGLGNSFSLGTHHLGSAHIQEKCFKGLTEKEKKGTGVWWKKNNSIQEGEEWDTRDARGKKVQRSTHFLLVKAGETPPPQNPRHLGGNGLSKASAK